MFSVLYFPKSNQKQNEHIDDNHLQRQQHTNVNVGVVDEEEVLIESHFHMSPELSELTSPQSSSNYVMKKLKYFSHPKKSSFARITSWPKMMNEFTGINSSSLPPSPLTFESPRRQSLRGNVRKEARPLTNEGCDENNNDDDDEKKKMIVQNGNLNISLNKSNHNTDEMQRNCYPIIAKKRKSFSSSQIEDSPFIYPHPNYDDRSPNHKMRITFLLNST